MGKLIFITLISLFVFTNNAFADKIYLKSGKILGGKLKENKNPMPWDDWCVGENDIQVWSNGSGQCISKSDIEKVEKELKKPEGIALLAKEDRWGKESNGYRTQLIPAGNEYVIGKPMVFHLVMQNVSDEVKWYDDQGLAHPSFKIIGPDGKEIISKVGPFQTGGAEEPIDTGEIVALMESRDITSEYVITEPGKYSIQFSAGWPESNMIEFEVRQGQPKKEDILISSLFTSIPDKCFLHKGWESTPQDRQAIQAVSLGIFCPKIHRMTGETFLWQTEQTVDISANAQDLKVKVSEYLGKNESGYVYFSPSEELVKIWPSIKEDIIKALKLNR